MVLTLARLLDRTGHSRTVTGGLEHAGFAGPRQLLDGLVGGGWLASRRRLVSVAAHAYQLLRFVSPDNRRP